MDKGLCEKGLEVFFIVFCRTRPSGHQDQRGLFFDGPHFLGRI